MKTRVILVAVLATTFALIAAPRARATEHPPTATEAEAWLQTVEAELMDLWDWQQHADWVRNTFITDDTELLGARANEAVMEYVGRRAAEATKWDSVNLPEVLRRKLTLLKSSLDMPAPRDPAKRAELARISTAMDSLYGKGKYCPPRLNGECLDLVKMEEILAKSRNYDELLDVWQGWHKVSPPMRQPFMRFVELGNEGAREVGFANLGDLWTSRYDMPSKDFQAETDRLWRQVEPLYKDLHCYARAKLQQAYGRDKVRDGQPIPAHLLGNMWAQEWDGLYDILAPDPGSASAIDLEKILKSRGTDERQMVKYAEAFFVSLGLTALPKTFWERSMFTKPRDREVVCHASAWDVDNKEDLRIKMCIQVNDEDFTTIHHELGHNYYQWAYRHLSPLFLNSANDGFHEALGDLIALSVTPAYLKKIGLIDKEPASNLNPLMKRALGQDRVPAVRADGRQVALGRVRRQHPAREVQPGVVGPAAQVPGRGLGGRAQRGGLRPGRQVPHPGQRSVHAVLPGGHPAVPVPAGAVQADRAQGAAEHVQHLRDQEGRRADREDDGNGVEQAVAGGAEGADR